ncbi:MAG TPA: DUF4845 domain-containing protein [Gammaproteobacteria bacterium]|nr:DUF4845 domain-containing protein [Gammaproteobacteria bacterium]
MEPYRNAHRVTPGSAQSGAAVPRWFRCTGRRRRADLFRRSEAASSPRRVRGPRPGLERQAGITAIGFLLLAALFGVVGFAALRLVPMYMQNLKLSTVLDEVHSELDGQGATSGSIRVALGKHFDIEGIELPSDDVKINPVRDGYQVRIQYENRAHYLADIWLVVIFDKQIQIRR